MSHDEAAALARSLIEQMEASDPQDRLVLVDASTIERPFGWVFFYDSARHMKTGDDRHRVFGNAPIIVDKRNGSAHFTGTCFPIEYYIKAYEHETGLATDPPDARMAWVYLVAAGVDPERSSLG
jgi:hypothetical protein